MADQKIPTDATDGKSVGYARPLRATKHCRHYSYSPGLKGGPQCAVGCNVSGSVAKCMPDRSFSSTREPEQCDRREEYTDDERAAWERASAERLERLAAAVQALPKAIPLRTDGDIVCPNCGGRLQYSRWHRGASIQCETPFCCGAQFNIAAGADWPARG